jgi:thymidylate kinase
MDQDLREMFQMLGERVQYRLLRGFEDLESGEFENDIDLLVDREDLNEFVRVVAAFDFAEIPSWGHGPHRFFLAYRKPQGRWIKLDVVDEVCYGQAASLHLPTRLFFASHRLRGEVYTLSPQCELAGLVLHCILDKRAFRPSHRDALHRCVREIGLEQRDMAERESFNRQINPFLPNSLGMKELKQAIVSGHWEELLGSRRLITRHLFWKEPLGSCRRWLWHALARRLRPAFLVLRHHGLMVALLAPDGAGKTTLARKLTRDSNIRARLIYMGTNLQSSTLSLPWSRKLEHVFSGREKESPRLLRAVKFVNTLLEQWLRLAVAEMHKLRGRNVVFDRYVYDLWLRERPRRLGKRVRRWLMEKGWPTPDIVVLLDAPGEVLFRRKGEHSPDYLERQRIAYRRMHKLIPNLVQMDATRSESELTRDLTAILWRHSCGERIDGRLRGGK